MPLPRLACLALSLPALAFAAPTPPPVQLKDFLGICGHTVQFHPDRYEGVVSVVRDYHPIRWDLADDTATPAPLPLAKNKVDWNHIYGDWKKVGMRVHASLMLSNLPAKEWKNLDADAFAYARDFAKMAGPSGRDWLEAVEIGNEPGHYSDADYVRVFDAMTRGIREGDPKLKIATCNVTAADKSGSYDKSLKLFLPFLDRVDILTVHTYANTDGWPTWHRTFPEDPATPYLREVRDVVAWRDAHAKGKPVWVTEFGWDAATSLAGRKGSFAMWEGNVTDAAQAAYLLRSIPLFLNEGVERAHIYFFDDKDEPQMHGAAGILRNGQPKPSWFALRQMQSLLGDAHLERLDHNGPFYIATWRQPDASVWLMLWTAEADSDTRIPHTFTAGNLADAISMTLDASTPAVLHATPAGPNRWTLPVGPRPIFLRVMP